MKAFFNKVKLVKEIGSSLRFQSKTESAIFILYILVAFLLFFYSFTQVDLGLTLSQVSVWQSIQKSFQYVGYFNRPLSTAFFVTLLFGLYTIYFIFLAVVRKRHLRKDRIWLLILVVTGILTLSYNAFSYDLFNYIFDAKIFTYYQLNPYEYKALDFPQDPMLGFMHWTHRTYPYGPIWLFISTILSYGGFQFFAPTLVLFKGFSALCFLGTVWFTTQIVKQLFPKYETVSLVFLGLNPFMLIESVISAHNDIVMLFFMMVSLWFLLRERIVRSIVFYLLSIGVKFATVFLLPVFLVILHLKQRNHSINWERMFLASLLLMIVAVSAASISRGTLQPWYLLYMLPFAALLTHKWYVYIPSIILPLFAPLLYVPYLYLGNWDPPVPQILLGIQVIGVIVTLVVTVSVGFLTKGK